MVYIIKFFYQTFLLPPGILIVFFAVLSIILHKKRCFLLSKVLIAVTIVLYTVSVPITSYFLLRPLEDSYNPPANPEGDVIIMLGGGATVDTPNVHGQGHLSGFAANRLITCFQLNRVLDVPIIISGGQVFGYTGSESQIAKSILVDMGVPEDMIITETKSLNTTQNALLSKEIVDQYGFKKPIVVTSAFHMKRSVRQFEKVDLEVIPYPTDYQVMKKLVIDYSLFTPSAEALFKSSLALKEYIGIMASSLY